MRRNVHKVDFARLKLHYLVPVPGHDFTVYKTVILVNRFVCSCADIFVLSVGGKIYNIICDNAVLYDTIGSFNKTEIIYSCISSKIGDKTDIRTLRGLYRTHPSVMCIMNITHLKRRSVSRQSSGTERGQTPLVSKLRERVGLIHKLG